jgi:hypothetical protein
MCSLVFSNEKKSASQHECEPPASMTSSNTRKYVRSSAHGTFAAAELSFKLTASRVLRTLTRLLLYEI